VSASPLLFANVGAEAGPAWTRLAEAPPVRSVARLWRRLFAPEAPAFDWLPGPGSLAAWLNTAEAAREAVDAGLPLAGAAPAVVRRVHDKAFAQAVARREGLVPEWLAETLVVLEPEDLLPEATAIQALEARLAGWPAWARRRFTLKPRLGSSGRGRVAGEDGRARTPAVRGALARLADRGGALLEPWLPRTEDLSAQLLVGADGSLRMLGTTRQLLAPSGLYRGQAGSVDTRGRIASGSAQDGALREAAVAVARAAAEQGYAGPCGLDAFSCRAPSGATVLRPVVEFNARYTLGIVAIGLLRRALPAAAARLGLQPDAPLEFRFALEAPPGLRGEAPRNVHLVPLGEPDEPRGPALLFARERSALEQLLGPEA
jgi:hypothetical protein